MAAIKQSFRLVVLFLVAGSILFAGVWIGKTGFPDQLPGGPIAVQAGPLTPEGSEPDAEAPQYQTWQELAYLSVLFTRLAYTYRGLETKAVGADGYLLPPSGEDPTKWWKDICNPGNPSCEWNIGEFARCEILLAGKVQGVFDRVNAGIARAKELMGGPETFKFKNTVLRVPDEDLLDCLRECSEE